MSALTIWSDKQIALIRKTVAKDCDRDSKGNNLMLGEFDWFMEICRSLKLDPLRKQIYCFCFNKDDPEKRQMVPVIGIGGYRSIAERTGNYRPGPCEIVYADNLKDPDANPLGISHATVTVYKHSHGEWHAYSDTAHWDEYAPIRTEAGEGEFEWVDTGEVWQDSGKPKKKKVAKAGATFKPRLDPKKDGWRKMGRIMIEKCAEAKALRRGWPDDFTGTYADGELDKAEVIDLTATEMAENAETARRLEYIGGINKVMVDWTGKEIVPVAVGEFADEAIKFVRKNKDEPSVVLQWQDRNRHSLQQFWAMDKDGALALKQEIEKATAA